MKRLWIDGGVGLKALWWLVGLLSLSACETLEEGRRLASNCAAPLHEASALQTVNRLRASGRSCGGTYYPAVAPLVWNAQLEAAAQQHTREMAAMDQLTHQGPQGGNAILRAKAAHYPGLAGENIVRGSHTLPEAIKVWLESPAHCANLMNPDYRDYAIACHAVPNSKFKHYWTQMFGFKVP